MNTHKHWLAAVDEWNAITNWVTSQHRIDIGPFLGRDPLRGLDQRAVVTCVKRFCGGVDDLAGHAGGLVDQLERGEWKYPMSGRTRYYDAVTAARDVHAKVTALAAAVADSDLLGRFNDLLTSEAGGDGESSREDSSDSPDEPAEAIPSDEQLSEAKDTFYELYDGMLALGTLDYQQTFDALTEKIGITLVRT